VAESEPAVEPIVEDDRPLAPWARARELLAHARTYWLGTTGPDGRVHVRPLIAVVVDGVLQVPSNAGSRKSRNLSRDPRCTITASCEGLDMALEGTAAVVSDPAGLRRAAQAFLAKYDWPLTPQDGVLDAEYGAPTSGGPPYQVWALTPEVAFGFPTAGTYAPTRWRFPR
jgi:hypothetical protein